MNYEKKLKTRIYVGIIYCIIAASMIILNTSGIVSSDTLSSFGTALFAIGAVRIVKTKRIMKNPEILKKMEIEETDERNILISQKAQQTAAAIMLVIGAAAIIILQIMEITAASLAISYIILGYLIIYLICRMIYQRKY